jgi:hypothetical protein
VSEKIVLPWAVEEFSVKKINRREFVATTAAARATVFASSHAFALPALGQSQNKKQWLAALLADERGFSFLTGERLL